MIFKIITMKILNLFLGIPFLFFLFINITLMIVIFILQNIGNGIVWLNDNAQKMGDWCGEKSGITDAILNLQNGLKKK